MVEWVVLPVALLLLVGECSAVLWLPALAADLWLAVREPKSRKVLLPLTAGCLLCLLIVWGGPRLAEACGVRLRDWLTTGPLCLLVLLFIALLVMTARYGVRHIPRRWLRRLAKAGAVLSVYSVLLWGFFFLCLTARTETVGEWQGQKVVMQKLVWQETTYNYYAYNGPFLLGERLGWSEGPWGLEP